MTKRRGTKTRKRGGGMWDSLKSMVSGRSVNSYGSNSYGYNPMQQPQQIQQPPRYGYGGKGTKRRKMKRSRTMKRR